jgi:enoyl-CoA hydratase
VIEGTEAVPVVRLNRPEALGALNGRVLTALDEAFAALAKRPATRAIVLTSTGEKAFSAGADLDELAGLNSAEAHDMLSGGQAVLRRIELCQVPVVAAVNGLALGGGFELVLATTFPVLAEKATLGLPEAGLGLMPGYGGTQRLTRSIGPQAATHVMLTGTRLSAVRAYQLGLTPVEPVPREALLDTAVGIAEAIAGRGPRAVRSILTAVRAAADLPLDGGLTVESALAAMAAGGSEGAEGVAAFRERRPPKFAEYHDGTAR